MAFPVEAAVELIVNVSLPPLLVSTTFINVPPAILLSNTSEVVSFPLTFTKVSVETIVLNDDPSKYLS